MTRQCIFYGAGKYAAQILGKNPEIKLTPTPPSIEEGVCFADADIVKQGGVYFDLPVVSIETALVQYENADIYIAMDNLATVGNIYADLMKLGVKPERILNYQLHCPYLKYFIVCGYHEGAFGGRAGSDSGGHSFKSCCSDYGKNNVAFIPIKNDLSEAFEKFLALRDDTIRKLKTGEPTSCDGCHELKILNIAHLGPRPEFSYVIFNELGVCNCKCSYCNYQERLGRDTSADVDFLHLMTLVEQYGFNKQEGIVELCNGEITIHPRKKEIYQAVQDYRVMFLTNGLVYDAFIHKKLEDGTGILNLSIDCGTRETFKKVKGVDAFNRVCETLRRYACDNKGVMNLKYIFLPGINDNFADVDGFINLCVDLNATAAHVSHNLCLSYEDYDSGQMVTAAKYMIEELKKHSIRFELYSKNIINKIIEID